MLTGISYNGMRPLDMAHQKSHHTKVRGVLTPLTSIPYDYKVRNSNNLNFCCTIISMLKARNPELFVDSGLESTSRLFSHDGSGKSPQLYVQIIERINLKVNICCLLKKKTSNLG